MEQSKGELDSMEIISYCFLQKNGRVIKSMNRQLPVIPASNMKLVTTISALDLLGSDFKFNTKFASQEKRMFISGDPAFFLNSSKFERIAGGLGMKEVDAINFENPRIDNKNYNSHWSYGDSEYSYQPKITNFFINENCKIKSGATSDETNYDYIHQNEDEFTPLRNPNENFTKALALKNKKIQVKRIKRPKNDNENSFSYKVEIKDVLKHILYESCNFYAEVLFKYLSSSDGKTGSWEASSRMIKERLAKIDGSDKIRIVDGSGLSKDNFVTTNFLSNLLLYAQKSFGDNYIKLLPTSGLGTLRRRLATVKEYGIFAKTGTLFGVSSLSGYIQSLDVSFSIIMNNSLEGAKNRQERIDKILVDFIEEFEKSDN